MEFTQSNRLFDLRYKARASVKKNLKYIIIFPVFLIFSLCFFFLIKSGSVDEETLIENSRYFFSAAAQSLATLVAIVLIIYNIVSSRIPSYEPIFKQHYPLILNKYHELTKVRKLIILSGISITILLVSILFLFKNTLSLFILVIINIFVLIYSLIEFILFFSTYLIKSGKDKFFEDCEWLLENELGYQIMKDIFYNILEFNNNLPSSKYSSIIMDRDRINSLPNSIIMGLGNKLKVDEYMGSSAYYRCFEDIIKEVYDKRDSYEVWHSYLYNILPNFEFHVKMCIKDGHCIKYIPDLIRVLTEFLKGFDKVSDHSMYKTYLKTFIYISKSVKKIKDGRLWLDNYGLSDIRNSVAINGLAFHDFFIDLISKLGLTKKEKKEQLNKLIEDYQNYYFRVTNEDEFKERIKEHNSNKYVELRDVKFFLENIKNKLKELDSG